MAHRRTIAIAGALLVAACGSTSGGDVPDDGGVVRDAGRGVDAATPSDAMSSTDTGAKTDASTDASTINDAAGVDSGVDAGVDSGQSLVQQLTTLTANCNVASNGKYATDQGAPPTIDICKLNGAFFWTADMDVDCDGKTTTPCNSTTDPSYQNQTSFTDSKGNPLDAANLPYVVIPLASARFDYAAQGIAPGAVVIVLYNGQLEYGVFGDEGPSDIIGEASYAMASSLGIDPNPATGGVDSGVTYIVFTGPSAAPSMLEDHAATVTLGQSLAAQLIQNN
jgi:hypothetical protein